MSGVYYQDEYYQDESVTLYHGDCRNIGAWQTAQVLVTDPPYGMAYNSGWRKGEAQAAIAGDGDTVLRDWVLSKWGPRPAIVFGRWSVRRPENVGVRIVWDKGEWPGMGDLKMPWGPSDEEIYILGKGFVGQREGTVIRVNRLATQSESTPDHPTPKPVSLMERLIAKCPPGVIADPFAGSGATLVAARNQGRKAIGVELEERYCEVIAKRLAQDVLFGGAA